MLQIARGELGKGSRHSNRDDTRTSFGNTLESSLELLCALFLAQNAGEPEDCVCLSARSAVDYQALQLFADAVGARLSPSKCRKIEIILGQMHCLEGEGAKHLQGGSSSAWQKGVFESATRPSVDRNQSFVTTDGERSLGSFSIGIQGYREQSWNVLFVNKSTFVGMSSEESLIRLLSALHERLQAGLERGNNVGSGGCLVRGKLEKRKDRSRCFCVRPGQCKEPEPRVAAGITDEKVQSADK